MDIELQGGQIVLGEAINPIQVSIGQFYGIEINDFAVTVAKTALWIAESQMMKETEDIVHMSLDFLPLKSYANITEGNALIIYFSCGFIYFAFFIYINRLNICFLFLSL